MDSTILSNGATPASPESQPSTPTHNLSFDDEWRKWGPYLSERQWGTVREDYSEYGTAWEFFPHDHARSRAYRWSEDGLLGITDSHQNLCFALALWNGRDAILKERLFGLTGNEGNHGEDVKEAYYFLDSTPTHSYLKGLYRYPQRAYPYADLVATNRARGRSEPEYELLDTGVFADDRYFDVLVEYAKHGPEDIVVRVSVTNRGPEAATLHLLPTLWFRNTWAWGRDDRRPRLWALPNEGGGWREVQANHYMLGDVWLTCQGAPELLFTENETNATRLWGVPNRMPYVKDGINDYVVSGQTGAVNPAGEGTKVAAHYVLAVGSGATEVVLLRLSHHRHADFFVNAEEILRERQQEADRFYDSLVGDLLTDEEAMVHRQALAGLLWSKQFYHYDVPHWLDGDPAGPRPPAAREHGRNSQWRHVNNADVILMPDTWEYPWYAAWDLAFHCVAMALVDPTFAKDQLVLLLREWYMHPNGQLPAYEWAFGDVNPPVHAWAAWRVYKIEKRLTGFGDRTFLQKVFHKLLLNFTWWVNRKDSEGRNVFQGGFLGLDNIGVFDRSQALPTGGYLEQSDGTAWMGMFCLNMMAMALELAWDDLAYEDVATKFFEHFLYIAGAMNDLGGEGIDLWDEEDGFFYDVLHLPDGSSRRIKVRSLVGLIPLLAVETVEPDLLKRLPDFGRRLRWFLSYRKDLASLVPTWREPRLGKRRLLALVSGERLGRLLVRLLDEDEFLSPYGIRSLSKDHAAHPYEFRLDDTVHMVRYEPAESTSGVFGGNSNWRGPIWFPINYLLIEALERFHHYYGDDFLVEHPSGSRNLVSLKRVATDLSDRLIAIFLRDRDGRRPVFGSNEVLQTDPHWRDHVLFYEYFHGDTGAGVGAGHQTGWTALVAKLLDTRSRVGMVQREELTIG
jgi:Glycosyl hydrolase family 63 C-terminal domain